MEEPLVRGDPVEILSLYPGKCEGQPVLWLTIRINPETHLRALTLLVSQEQTVLIRDVLNSFLNNPNCWLHMPKDLQQALALEDAGVTCSKDDAEDDDLSDESLDDILEDDEIVGDDDLAEESLDDIPLDDDIVSKDDMPEQEEEP